MRIARHVVAEIMLRQQLTGNTPKLALLCALREVASKCKHTGQHPYGPLEVRIYPGADGAFDLYEDAGDGYGYERGEFAFTPFRWSEQAQRLTVQDRVGAFPGMPASRVLEPVLVSETSGVGSEKADRRVRLNYLGATLDSSAR